MPLPNGWTESSPGGMATCADPLYGGIVDARIVGGAWFVIFHDEALDAIEGFASRDEAFAAFSERLNVATAERLSTFAMLVGTPHQTPSACLFEKMDENAGLTDSAYSVAKAKTELLQDKPFAEQVKAALDGGVSPDRLAQAIWGDSATWARVYASYSRPQSEIVARWAGAGFKVVSTGGGFWAAMHTRDGINFALTDYAESEAPNPDYPLHVGAYSAESGEYLGFSVDVGNLDDALGKLPGWTEELQAELKPAKNDDQSARKSAGPRL